MERITMIPIVLLATLGAASVVAGDPAGEPGAPLTVRTYDIAPLSVDLFQSATLNLAPSLKPNAMEELNFDEDEGFQSDAVISLIEEVFPDQFDYADRGLWQRSRRELLVRAPQPLQEQVAALIAGLEQAATEHAELRVDVLTVPTARLGGTDWRGVVSSQAAQELRGMVGSDASARTHRMTVYPGRAASVDLRRQQQVLLDYDVEIAQGAAIHDPVVTTLSVGTRLLLSAAPQQDGLALAYVLDRSDPLGGAQRRSTRQRIFVSGESFTESWNSAQASQSLETVTRSVAGDARLASGSALVLRSDLDLTGVKNSELVIIEQVGGSLSASHSLATAGIVLVNAETLAPPRCRFAGAWPRYDVRWPGGLGSRPWDDGDIYFGAELETGDLDDAMEMIATSSTGLTLDAAQPWIIGRPDPDAIRELQDAGAEVNDIADVLAAYGSSSQMLDLHVLVRKGGRDGARVASCVLPVQVGGECVAALGREQLMTSEADVEVAQNAAAADMIVQVDFEGLLLRARPHRGSTGALVLDLTGEARVLVDQDRFNLESSILESLDLSTIDRLAFDERLVLTPGAEPVVLTETAGEGGGAALTLEVSVR
jgi:hypothetical protein